MSQIMTKTDIRKFCCINTLRKHKNELETVLNERNIDVIGLNETRLESKVPNSVVSIENYQIYRKDRNTAGGGVAVYVRETLPHFQRIDITDQDLEVIGIEITPKNAKSFVILCWYRPPTDNQDSKSFDTLEGISRKLDSEDKEVILIGDTNCDLKSQSDWNTKRLKSLYSFFQFEQQIKEYTRVASKINNEGKTIITKSLIDHFATNRVRHILKSEVIQIGMVDHYLIIGTRKINAWRILQKCQKTVETQMLKNYNKDEFLSALHSIDFITLFSELSFDPNQMTASFHETFESLLNLHAPLRKRKVRSEYAPWINPSIKELMRKRDQTKRLATNDIALWPKYKKLRNLVTSRIRDAIKDYFSQKISDSQGNPSKMWKTINTVLGKTSKTTSVAMVEFENKQLTDKKEITSAFNRHFTNVGPSLAGKIEGKLNDDPTRFIPSNEASVKFKFKPATKQYVLNALRGLKSSKSPGPDRIPAKILKDAAEVICDPLKIIFNESLKVGIFPDIWKTARVTPIFKSGPQSDLNNYRPISVLSAVSRTFEKVA